MEIALKKENAFSATLLVTGCCIGAGMIGLPVMSALGGFIPTTFAMILCYLFATGTGLLILEATLWFEHKVNLISLADFALGRLGKFVTWSLFLFLFYCVFVAYIDGGGQLVAGLLSFVFQQPVSREIGIFVCVGTVGAIVYAGTHAVSGINRIFVFGLVGSYCVLMSLALPHVNTDRLLHVNLEATLATVPILMICFGYQNLIPTLTYYVKKNISTLRIAIFVGNLIPFLIYFLWNFAILGILPNADDPSMAQTGQTSMVTGLLEKASQSKDVVFFAAAFSFFGIITPFIANTLAFVDFLKDGFKMRTESKYAPLVYALVLVPPMILTLLYPHLFLKALGIAGGFADVILFGILPVLIVSIGRYVKKIEGPYTAPGGKLMLVLVFLFSLFVLLVRN